MLHPLVSVCSSALAPPAGLANLPLAQFVADMLVPGPLSCSGSESFKPTTGNGSDITRKRNQELVAQLLLDMRKSVTGGT